MREHVTAWDGATHEERGELADTWFDTVPEIMRLLKQRRRAFKVDAQVLEVSPRDWLRLCARYHDCCAYCGKGGEAMTLDHVLPLVQGGRHAIGNILPVCSRCNSRKGGHLLVKWRYRHNKGPTDLSLTRGSPSVRITP